jgi:carbon storage regulator
MLVLTRKEGEGVVIGYDILVSVLAVDGERVRLGIEAPADIPVDRQEIHTRRLLFPDGPPSREPGETVHGRA